MYLLLVPTQIKCKINTSVVVFKSTGIVMDTIIYKMLLMHVVTSMTVKVLSIQVSKIKKVNTIY